MLDDNNSSGLITVFNACIGLLNYESNQAQKQNQKGIQDQLDRIEEKLDKIMKGDNQHGRHE